MALIPMFCGRSDMFAVFSVLSSFVCTRVLQVSLLACKQKNFRFGENNRCVGYQRRRWKKAAGSRSLDLSFSCKSCVQLMGVIGRVCNGETAIGRAGTVYLPQQNGVPTFPPSLCWRDAQMSSRPPENRTIACSCIRVQVLACTSHSRVVPLHRAPEDTSHRPKVASTP